jgi:D-tagatose-1,6-bisphosphate aldolase subunit GatZ/KbaZ
MTALRETIARNLGGQAVALPSVCSAHPDVLRASLALAEQLDTSLIVEATSNQVNQFGGYTGMTPDGFLGYVRGIASQSGCDADRVTFGGDHLGPQAWRDEPAERAMAKARDMVAAYARSGVTKIHLDCAEGCAGEAEPPGNAVSAARAAELAEVALSATPHPEAIDFIVGTEVPPPGGARDDEVLHPTDPEAAKQTMRVHFEAFSDRAAERIVGLVVQPGVEFGAWDVDHLPETPNIALRAVLDDFDGLAFEAHSTDYQRDNAFRRLAEMGFAILKVGPALTYAYRRAIYALDHLAETPGLAFSRTASVRETAEQVMVADPGHWQKHYAGDEMLLRQARHYALSDRIRYYWPRPELAEAVRALREGLTGQTLRRPVLSQFFAESIIDRADDLEGAADQVDALVQASIQAALSSYFICDAR